MAEKRGFDVLSEEKFAEIYRAYWKRLYSVGYNYVRDRAVSQELVQEVFVKFWLKRNEIKQIEDTEAYLLTALRNRIYDHFDSVETRKKHDERALAGFSEERDVVEEAVVFNEAMSLIGDELERMPVKTQMIFRMSKFGRHSNEEIAEKMHVSSKAVEYHITQALKKLRVRLAVFLS